MAYREEAQRFARFRIIGAAAAVVVIGVAIWPVYRSLGPHDRKREEVTANNANVTYQANPLDLRERSALRGAAPNPKRAPDRTPKRRAHAWDNYAKGVIGAIETGHRVEATAKLGAQAALAVVPSVHESNEPTQASRTPQLEPAGAGAPAGSGTRHSHSLGKRYTASFEGR